LKSPLEDEKSIELQERKSEKHSLKKILL